LCKEFIGVGGGRKKVAATYLGGDCPECRKENRRRKGRTIKEKDEGQAATLKKKREGIYQLQKKVAEWRTETKKVALIHKSHSRKEKKGEGGANGGKRIRKSFMNSVKNSQKVREWWE